MATLTETYELLDFKTKKIMNKKINLEKNRSVINVLGEVCWGFQVDDFEIKIGARKEIVEALLERLLSEKKAGLTETNLSPSEIKIIKKSLIEVEKEIDEREFHTRLGVTLEEIKKMPIFK